QQLVEFDEIAIEVEVDGLHGRQGREMRARWPLRSITTPPRSIATTPRSPMRSPSAMRWPSRMTKRRAGDGSHMCMLSRTGGRPLASMSATSVDAAGAGAGAGVGVAGAAAMRAGAAGAGGVGDGGGETCGATVA